MCMWAAMCVGVCWSTATGLCVHAFHVCGAGDACVHARAWCMHACMHACGVFVHVECACMHAYAHGACGEQLRVLAHFSRDVQLVQMCSCTSIDPYKAIASCISGRINACMHALTSVGMHLQACACTHTQARQV